MSSSPTDHPSLRDIQESMAARIVGSAPTDPGESAAPLEEWLEVPAPGRAGDRLRVYTNGYPVRVQDALAETYPTVAGVVGASAFAALAQRYAASVPLRSYNLNHAGAQMPAFLRHDELTGDRPFLPDLAELEWGVACAFHAAEAPALDPRALAWGVEQWAEALLHFQPAVAVVSSAWPLLDLWGAREAAGDAILSQMRDHPEPIVIRRIGLTVRCESVSEGEALALRLLLDGGRLGETAEKFEADGLDPSEVLAWFSRWISAGMIADATVRE